MKIVGIGVDIIQNSRIKKAIKNKSFVNRIFAKSEILSSKNIKFSNKVNNLIVKKFKTRNFDIFLSLSDEKNYSIAFVIIQKK